MPVFVKCTKQYLYIYDTEHSLYLYQLAIKDHDLSIVLQKKFSMQGAFPGILDIHDLDVFATSPDSQGSIFDYEVAA